MALTNAITVANGTYKQLPNGDVLMTIPYNENPQILSIEMVQICLIQIQSYHPAIHHFEVSNVQTEKNGLVLQITVCKGV